MCAEATGPPDRGHGCGQGHWWGANLSAVMVGEAAGCQRHCVAFDDGTQRTTGWRGPGTFLSFYRPLRAFSSVFILLSAPTGPQQ